MVAGIGCRRGVTRRRRCWRRSMRPRGGRRLDALAVRAGEARRAGAGARRRRGAGLPLLVADGAAATDAARRRSAASLAATGHRSASEAAALAVAGPAARLLGPRLVVGRVTCAIAVAEAGMTVHFIGAGPGAADLITAARARSAGALPGLPLCRLDRAGGAAGALPAGGAAGRYRAAVARRDRGRVGGGARRGAGRGAAALGRSLGLERGRRADPAAGGAAASPTR